MPEAPNNRFWPAAVMTASKHLTAPIGGYLRAGADQRELQNVTSFLAQLRADRRIRAG
jgi:hypothetical protein